MSNLLQGLVNNYISNQLLGMHVLHSEKSGSYLVSHLVSEEKTSCIHCANCKLYVYVFLHRLLSDL